MTASFFSKISGWHWVWQEFSKAKTSRIMITATYPIRFNFLVDSARLDITLEADVQEHHSASYYVVGNFHVPGHRKRTALPQISVKKAKGVWVHTDSGKSTELSLAVGKAIDALKSTG
jgi:hypothetical protein